MVRINGGGGLSLCGLFPRLFRLAANMESSVCDCFEVKSDYNVWRVLFKRVFGLWRGNYMRSY